VAKKQRKFADDGWAIWIDGDDTSTVYINDWLNPKGKSYVDLAIRIRGIKSSNYLCVYVPFKVNADEIEDVSLLFEDKKIFTDTMEESYKKYYLYNMIYNLMSSVKEVYAFKSEYTVNGYIQESILYSLLLKLLNRGGDSNE
jgi:hypothetical protein